MTKRLWRREVRPRSTTAEPPRRRTALAVLLATIGLVAPLAVGTSQLPAGTTPTACVPGGQAAASTDSFVVVPTASSDGTLYSFDSTAGALLGSNATVGFDPIAIAVDTTYQQVYVLNAGYGGSDGPSVSVLSYANNGLSPIETLSTPGTSPTAIGVSPGGNHVVVADSGADEVSVIDPQANPPDFVGNVTLPGPPSDLAFSQDVGGVFALYAGDTTNDRLYLLTLTSSSVAPYYSYQSEQTSIDPTSVLAAGMTLYVGDAGADHIDRYATDVDGTQAELDSEGTAWSVPSTNPPDDLAVTPDGATLYVASGTTSFLALDTKSGAWASHNVPGGTGNTAGPMAVNADGTVLELAEGNEAAVARWAVEQQAAQDAVTGWTGVPSAVASVPAAALRFYAYVAQSAPINTDGTGDVSVVDLLAGQDISDIPVGVNPEAVLSSPDGSSVYIADTGTGSNGSLKAIATADINTATNPVRNVSTTPAIPFSSGAWPDALALSPSGDQLLVADYNRGAIYDIALNTAAPHAMTTIYLNDSGPSAYDPVAIAMSPSGSFAYVTDHNDHSIVVLQTTGQDQPYTWEGRLTGLSPALTSPHGAAVSPDGRTLYVADEGAGNLDAYPIASTGLLGSGKSAPVGASPESVAVSPLGSPIYVAVAGTDKTAVVTAGSLAVTQAQGGPVPSGVAVTPDASQFLVTNNNLCDAAGSMWIYGAGQTTASTQVNFDIAGNKNTNPFAVAVGPAFSAPATPQFLPPGELAGGGVNPSEVATQTAAQDVRAGVDTATGAYSITPPGLSVASPGLPLDFSATYDSANAGTPGPLGFGWTFSYDMTLGLVGSGVCQWQVSQENSAIADFADVEGGTSCGTHHDPVSDYAAPARVQASISEVPHCPGDASTCFDVTRQADQQLFFSETPEVVNNQNVYPLVGEQDRYGNTLTLAYGGGQTCNSSELSTVTAQGAGLSGTRSLTFGWNCTSGVITSVTDPLGRAVTLVYNASELENYTLEGGSDRLASHIFSFVYNASRDLVSWFDPDNAANTGTPSDGTTIAYGTYASPNHLCNGSTYTLATSVTGPQVNGQGVSGTASYNPETKLDYSAYDPCTGDGTVSVADPNQMAGFGTQSVDTTLDYYVGRALLSTSAGYGPADGASVDDNATDGHPDAASAVTVYVRDPETLLAREVVDPDGNITATEWNALGDPVSVTDPNGNSKSYLYNPDNELTESVDQLGRTTTYTYSKAELTAVTDPAGNVTQYLQAADGETCAVLRPDAAAAPFDVVFTPDPLNNGQPDCTSTAGQEGVTSTTFDAYGDVATVAGAESTVNTNGLRVLAPSDVTSYADDLDGEVCGVLSPDGYVANGGHALAQSPCPAATGGPYLTVFPFYDVYGDVLQKTTPAQAGQSNGNKWLTYYDADGRKVAAMTPNDTGCDGNTSGNCTYATYDGYDAMGDLVSVTSDYGDTNGPNETTYTYDADGNRLSMVSPDGNASGNNPNNYRTVYSYDDLGRLVATQDPQGSPSCNPQTTAHCDFVAYRAYDAAGRLVTATTPATTAHADGTTTTTTYDGNGNVTEVLVSDFAASTTMVSEATRTYDAADELTSSVAPDGYWTSPFGSTQQSATSWTTTYTYDQDGRPATVVAPAGEGTTTGQGAGSGTTWSFYDSVGNRVALTNGDGNGATCNPLTTGSCASTIYDTYYLSERLASVQGAAGQASATTTTSTYDADGNPLVVTNPSGVTTTATYDSADELSGTAYSDGTPSVADAYNIDGTRASMSATGTGAYDFAYAYDKADRLTGVTNGSATVAAYGYDNSSNVTSLTYPSGLSVSDHYAVDSELSSTSWGTANSLTFSYDQAGNLQTTTGQAGSSNPTITTTDSYDGGQRLYDISTTSTAQSSPILDTSSENNGNQNLTIDPNGNPTGQLTTTGTTTLPPVYYAVDFANRANYDSTATPAAEPVATSIQTDTYDKANFVTQGAAVAVQQYYGDGEIEQATSVPGGAPVSFSYDPEQNRTGEQTPTATTSYAFDAAGGLCWSAPTTSLPTAGSTPACGSPPTGATTYTYDGDGLRRTETTSVGSQTFSWDENAAVPRLLEDGTNDYVYGPGGTPLAQVSLANGAVGFLVSDRQGSVRDVVSGSTGLSLAYTDYDVYGNPTTPGGLTALTPFGFQGGYTDASGLVYFEQRYYDPGSGQFLSLDPLNGSANSGYTFVKDNPFGYTDPTGQYYVGSSGAPGQTPCGGYENAGASCQNNDVPQSLGIVPQVENAYPSASEYAPSVLATSPTGPFTEPATDSVPLTLDLHSYVFYTGGVTLTLSGSIRLTGPQALDSVEIHSNGELDLNFHNVTVTFPEEGGMPTGSVQVAQVGPVSFTGPPPATSYTYDFHVGSTDVSVVHTVTITPTPPNVPSGLGPVSAVLGWLAGAGSGSQGTVTGYKVIDGILFVVDDLPVAA